MSSYYNRVTGSLSAAEIARSEDIHLIQSNIQAAFQEMMNDMFGTGCILGGEEEDLKLTPMPDHVDQSNTNYDPENHWFPFYDIYLSQNFEIEKSEINTIRVKMRNNTNVEPTIFAEIRDSDFNLVQETNIQLSSTLEKEDGIDVDFIFNLEHLPLGEYYFVIRPVDINISDLTRNGDESMTDYIDPSQIAILYDNNGNYNQGLYASYNGVDYLESRLLEADVVDDIIEVSSINYDLCFEQIFSVGNTYVINPAPCIVLGEKVYPIDTHVTIDGPSLQGDRVDLVSLAPDGTLNVTKGEAYLGPKTEANYPAIDIGFKIAYITTYKNSDTEWSCPNCGHINNSNIESCPICDTSTNTKIPLIEQGDDGTYTRQRDFLERLRRLEKKMSYQIENNSPSRIKYTCEVDPIIAYSDKDLKDKDADFLIIAEDTYNMDKEVVDGQTVVKSSGTSSKTYKWSIVNKKSEYDYTDKKTTNAKLTGWDVHMPLKQPKKLTSEQKEAMLFHATVTTKRSSNKSTTKTTTKKETNKSGKSTKTTTTETWYGVSNLKLKITIKDKNKKTVKTLKDIVTNKKGAVAINLWEAIPKIKAGTYKITTAYGDEKITNTIKVYSGKYKKTSHSEKTNLKLSEKQVLSTTYNIDDNTFEGTSHFYTENITLDSEDGIAHLKKANTKKDYKKIDIIPEDKRKKAKSAYYKYTIKPNSQSLQSEYCLYNVQFKKDCSIEWIKPYIKSFKNIKTFGIILFKNNQIFDVNYNRTTYTKILNTKKAANTLFPNIYKDKWTVEGTKKDGVITPKSQHIFTPKKPLNLTAGVYSILLWGTLKDPKKEGWIKIKEFTTSKASNYGAISRVKGTSNPAKIYIEKNGLVNKTMLVRFKKYDEEYKSSGTLISKTVDTKDDIKACTFKCSSNIPNGTKLHMYVSNNGGKTYIETEGGTVNFSGAGHELKWKIDFTGNASKGNSSVTPKVFFNKNGKYAVKVSTTTVKSYIGYEDYGRCYSTPILNANSITRTLVDNANVESSFSEWEYARLWMEMEDLSDIQKDAMVKTDICIAHEYDEYDINVSSKLTNVKGRIFFSQIFANLVPSDFSNTSVDYSNYDANVEPDELNYRFKLQSEKIEHYTGGVIVASPYDPSTYERDYFYGDINIEGIDTTSFAYGLCDMDTIYLDNDGKPTTQYAGMHVVSSPFYQVQYNHTLSILNEEDDEESESTTTEESSSEEPNAEEQSEITEETTSTTETVSSVWASDVDPNYDPEAILIGVSFDNGLEITDNYTDLHIDVIPNLGEFKEDKGVIQIDANGNPILKEGFQVDTTKYYWESKERYYIPKNTLEIVVALNKYGQIEDDNATYGKAYVIGTDLESGKHNQINIALDELYGSTIYSIGIRVSTKKDSDGNYIVREQQDGKHPSLHNGDCLGLGVISFGGYNRFPYTKYIYTGETDRWQWTALNSNFNSTAYAFCNVNAGSGRYLPYRIAGPGKNSDKVRLYVRQHSPALYFKEENNNSESDFIKYSDIKKEKNKLSFTHKGTQYKSSDNCNTILFDFAGATSGKTELGNMFKIKTNIRLAPYDFIDVAYYILQEYPGQTNNGQIFKGEFVLRLYDTEDITGATPIEELPLPAWGAIQNEYGVRSGDETKEKVVHAWYKIHTNADKVRCIVLHRANPVNRPVDDVKFMLNNILFYNAETMPALGPQMQLRVYPNTMNNLANTKIRKFGCIYRI